MAAGRIRLIYPHAFSLDSVESSLPDYLARYFQTHFPTLITVSGLEPEYDLSLQIDVLGQVRKRFPAAGLVIIGSGSLEAEVREQIRSKPYSVREALLIGTPVIATENGMRPNGTNLIPRSDPEALRLTIEQILTQGAPEQPWGDSGARNIEEVFELYQELLDE